MGVGRGIALGALIVSVFIFGIIAGLFINTLQESREEYVLGETTSEALLPRDRIQAEQVHVYNDHVSINIPGVQWATFTPTGSMIPVLGSNAHGLQIIPEKPSDIGIGDVISYHKKDENNQDKIRSHRVIAIGQDEQGWYATAQGDNNPTPDEEPIRFSQIDRVLVGILY